MVCREGGEIHHHRQPGRAGLSPGPSDRIGFIDAPVNGSITRWPEARSGSAHTPSDAERNAWATWRVNPRLSVTAPCAL